MKSYSVDFENNETAELTWYGIYDTEEKAYAESKRLLTLMSEEEKAEWSIIMREITYENNSAWYGEEKIISENN